jgi:hypothetical protein
METFTLAYGQTEHRVIAGRNNVEIMCETARKLISDNHPHVFFGEDNFYRWGGPEKGWLTGRKE